MTSLLFQGDNVQEIGDTLAPSSSLTVTFNDTGSGVSDFVLGYLDATNDTTVTINSDRDSSVTGGYNQLGQLSETNNDLTTVTITGSQQFQLGLTSHGDPNVDDGVVTDTSATAIWPTTIASSLKLIDASATTGAVEIYAGATNTPGSGDYKDGQAPNADVTTTYTGLKIEGGSGQDFIENDAANGTVVCGPGAATGDTIVLGGANATATDWGSDGTVTVGHSLMGTSELPGTACGDMVSLFGGGELKIGTGAQAGSTAGTADIGQTEMQAVQFGTIIDFKSVTTSSNIENEDLAVASASSITAAEDAAVKALGGAGVAYFAFGPSPANEYFVATNHAETAVSSHDAVVCLVGAGNNYVGTDLDGLVTLIAGPV
jgi:hypothetical protein